MTDNDETKNKQSLFNILQIGLGLAMLIVIFAVPYGSYYLNGKKKYLDTGFVWLPVAVMLIYLEFTASKYPVLRRYYHILLPAYHIIARLFDDMTGWAIDENALYVQKLQGYYILMWLPVVCMAVGIIEEVYNVIKEKKLNNCSKR